MGRNQTGLALVFLFSSVVVSLCALGALVSAQGSGWRIPVGGPEERNPLASTPAILKRGAALYNTYCRNCHGAKGLGDGPDADLKDVRGRPANLTVSRTLDGVMFYKIWNGRESPKMPAFRKEGLARNDVWTVIHFVKTFRK